MPATKKTASSSTKSAAAKDDAIKLLTADHAEVKKLFKEYEKLVKAEAEPEEKQALALQICHMLTVHATIEEEIFYPAARESDVDSDLLDEAEVEHASAKDLIAQIHAMDPHDDLYDAKVKVLSEQIEHHVEEEEKEMFPKAKKSGLDMIELGQAIQARKEEIGLPLPN